ncbi:MAG: pilus assembly protein, partial [Planctomycetes bacterium]|nr:pilus assembly protein [Planctomycetota bacterium]
MCGRSSHALRARRTSMRRGSVTLEFILVTPIIIILTWAVFQYGILLLVQQSVTHAAAVAAREAGKGEPIDVIGRVVDN